MRTKNELPKSNTTETRLSLSAKSGSKTILTEEIRYNKKLSSTQKIILAEIIGLYRKKKECWASNAYFAKKFDLTIKTISRCISHLQKLAIITVEIDKAAGNKRSIYLCEDTPKMSIPMDNNSDSSGQNKPEDAASLFIYKKNNKTKVEREEDSPSEFLSENFRGFIQTDLEPDQDEIEHYMKTLGFAWLKEKEKKEAQAFFDYYTALGWKMKGSPITNWQAAARNWLNKSQNFNKNHNEYSTHTKPNQQWLGHINRLNTDRDKDYAGNL